MKKLRSEYVAALPLCIKLSVQHSLPAEILKNCVVQAIAKIEEKANEAKNENEAYASCSVDYEFNGEKESACFLARLKEDFYDDSAAAGDVPVSVRDSEATKKERIRALRLSISDYLSKIERAAHAGAENPLFVADDIAAWAVLVQSETKELAKLDPKMVEKWKKIHESFLAI